MKKIARDFTNLSLGLVPKPILRYILKSVWYQMPLQDALQFHVEPYRWDSAIPTRFDLKSDGEEKRRNLPGVHFEDQKYLSFLKELAAFASELNKVPRKQTPGSDFWFENGWYQDFDAASLYCMIRALKPKRIIEAGCGFSSRVMMLARAQNQREGFPCECTFIEPYLERTAKERLGFSLEGQLIAKKIEEVPLSLFQELQDGDFLFLDTSHIVKANSDCCYQQLEIIPSLQSGVFVHIHDVFTPYDYPQEWVVEKHCAYTEQYTLECLLSENPKLEIILPVYWLWKEHRTSLGELLPSGTAKPGAFWIRRKAASAS